MSISLLKIFAGVLGLALMSGCDSVRPTTLEAPHLTTDTPAATAGADKSASQTAGSEPDSKNSGDLPVQGNALLDGFEGPEHTVWAFDSADDEGHAEYVEEGATQGKKALKISIVGKGKSGKIHLRRDVWMDFSHATALLFDITSPARDLSAVLAFKCFPDDLYQESKPITLKSGLNRNVRFAFDQNIWKNADSKWQFNGPPVNLHAVRRIMLYLFTGKESSGSFLIDNLRVEGEMPPDKVLPSAPGTLPVYKEWRPEILMLSPLPMAAAQYEPLEIQSVFRASYRDIFDSSDIAFGMRVTTPSGKNLDVHGFFGGLYRHRGHLVQPDPGEALEPLWGPFDEPRKKDGDRKKDGNREPHRRKAAVPTGDGASAPSASSENTEKNEKKETPEQSDKSSNDEEEVLPVWLLRFTPQETGRYTVQTYVRNSAGETRMPEKALVVAADSGGSLPGRAGGNVRLSRADARRLELQDGSPFLIFGQNVCWTQNWSPYLEKIHAYGGNTCRIWLCPWGLNLESKTDPGSYDLKEAARIDRLMAKAEETGVRIIFCMTFHGATASVWNDSPYNQVNGGPCARPQDFFTDWRAKKQFKRLLSYAAARWGASPALLSWELINEMDLARFDSPDDISGWIREMASHIHGADSHGHLVTTSTSNPLFQPELWQDSRLDFISLHAYGTHVPKMVNDYLSLYRNVNKPVILAEFGGGAEPIDDISDKEGARLKSALWTTACSPSCGLALPWWWDTYIEARGLYGVFASVGRFVKGEDRRGRYGEWVRKSYPDGVEVNGIMDSQGARLYVQRPGWIEHPETRAGLLSAKPMQLQLSGLLDGAYKLEFWDANEGKVFATLETAAANGHLSIELPAHESEFAIKADRKERLVPELK